MTNKQPDPIRVKWATDEMEKIENRASVNRSHLWSTLRDRVMTLSASTIALSLIALKISETPSQTELIKMSWVSLLVSLALGFVSIVLDYNVTARAERDAQVLSKLAAGVVDEETIEIAEKNREWFKKWGAIFVRTGDWSVYIGALGFGVGITLLTAFAWVNT
ncbi:MAG: hypothetical protein IH960_11800 [Chloroflexi bacterium]|nr:hypothetical protein [Chloroflexota bacterium]